jgi:hypothetical protein
MLMVWSAVQFKLDATDGRTHTFGKLPRRLDIHYEYSA